MEHRKRRVCLCRAQGKRRCEDQEAPTKGQRLQAEGLHKVGTKEKNILWRLWIIVTSLAYFYIKIAQVDGGMVEGGS